MDDVDFQIVVHIIISTVWGNLMSHGLKDIIRSLYYKKINTLYTLIK